MEMVKSEGMVPLYWPYYKQSAVRSTQAYIKLSGKGAGEISACLGRVVDEDVYMFPIDRLLSSELINKLMFAILVDARKFLDCMSKAQYAAADTFASNIQTTCSKFKPDVVVHRCERYLDSMSNHLPSIVEIWPKDPNNAAQLVKELCYKDGVVLSGNVEKYLAKRY